jgi:hypothetical protein
MPAIGRLETQAIAIHYKSPADLIRGPLRRVYGFVWVSANPSRTRPIHLTPPLSWAMAVPNEA